jgi:hypothetical protein
MGRAAAAGRLLSAHERDGCGQAARRLGRESAGLWAARGKKRGGRLGRASRRVGPRAGQPAQERGREGGREKRGGAPDGPQKENVGPRERGERGKGKRKGLFPILIIFLKAGFHKFNPHKKYAGTGMVQQSK